MRRLHRRSRLLLACAAGLSLAACDNALDIDRPDIVTPGNLQGGIGLTTLYNGAIGDFVLAYDGGEGDGSYADNVVSISSLLSDEVFTSETFPTRQEFDQRTIALDNSSLRDAYHLLQRARASLEASAAKLDSAAADAGTPDPREAELLALAGYAYIAFAENYCSGVPFSTATATGELVYGEPQTTAAILQTAVARFDAALAVGGIGEEIRDLALVGKARALLDAGDHAGAAAAAAGVPTGFVYQLFHSINGHVVVVPTTQEYTLENGLYYAMYDERRSSISNLEGGAGLPFRDAADPRLEVVEDPNGGFDTVSPQFDLAAYALTGDAIGRETSFPLASGVEARLIEAEAALAAGDAAGALASLNALRTRAAGLAPLQDAGSADARVAQLFSERAFWLYATAHRVGDMRRLIRQYGLPTDAVFPHGAYFKGGSYGPDVNFPIPKEELNNPDFQGCLDRNA